MVKKATAFIALLIVLILTIFNMVRSKDTTAIQVDDNPLAGQVFIDTGLPDMSVESSDDALKLLGMIDGKGTDFYLKNQKSTTAGTVYHVQQTYDGYDIYNAQRVVSVGEDGKADFVAGNVATGLNDDYGFNIGGNDLTNILDRNEALGLAELSSGISALYTSGADKVFWYFAPSADYQCAYQPIYEIIVTGTDETGVGTARNLLMNARSGEVYRIIDNEMSIEKMAYDAKFGDEEFGTAYSDDVGAYILKDLDRDITLYNADAPGSIFQDREYFFDGVQAYFSDENNIWDDGGNAIDNKNAVMIYRNMIRAYDFYTDIDKNAVKTPISVIANSAEVTGWNKKTGQFHFQKNKDCEMRLDVIGHEFTHFVIGADLQYYDMPGALHESFADCMGALIEDKQGEAFYSIGEDGVGSIIRTLDSSRKEVTHDDTVSHMDNYITQSYEAYGTGIVSLYDSGVHYNCGIPSMAFVKMVESNVFTRHELALLYYDTMTSLQADAEFWDARDIMLSVCASAFSVDSTQYKTVKDAWDSVGVSDAGRDDFSDYPQDGLHELKDGNEAHGRINYPHDYDCLKFVPEITAQYTFGLDRRFSQLGAIELYVLNESMDVIGCEEITSLSLQDIYARKYAKITCDIEEGHTYFVVIKGMNDLVEYTVTAEKGDEIILPESGQAQVLTGNSVEIIDRTIQYSNEYIDVDINYPEISGMLDSDLEAKVNAQIFSEMESNIQYIEKIAIDEALGFSLGVYTDFTVERNDGAFLSIFVDVYLDDYQSATGSEYGTYINILNSNPGRQLLLGDLFTPGSDYISTLNAETETIIASDENMMEYNFSTVREEQGFYLTDNALVLKFEDYEISSGIEGLTEIVISFSDLSEILIPELQAMQATEASQGKNISRIEDGTYILDFKGSADYDVSPIQGGYVIAADGGYLVTCDILDEAEILYDEYNQLLEGKTVIKKFGLETCEIRWFEEYDNIITLEVIINGEDGYLNLFSAPTPSTPALLCFEHQGEGWMYLTGETMELFISSDSVVSSPFDDFEDKSFDDYLETGCSDDYSGFFADYYYAEVVDGEIVKLATWYGP